MSDIVGAAERKVESDFWRLVAIDSYCIPKFDDICCKSREKLSEKSRDTERVHKSTSRERKQQKRWRNEPEKKKPLFALDVVILALLMKAYAERLLRVRIAPKCVCVCADVMGIAMLGRLIFLSRCPDK